MPRVVTNDITRYMTPPGPWKHSSGGGVLVDDDVVAAAAAVGPSSVLMHDAGSASIDADASAAPRKL
jgi:hypothetical protein